MIQTVHLDKHKHDRRRFDCGIEALNQYFRLMANQQSARDNTRTFVLEDPTQEKYVRGFYTLAMTSIHLHSLPQKLQKRHAVAQSAGLLARLAVDRRYQKEGLGAWLLVDALRKLEEACKSVAFPLVIVDSKDGVIGFYQKYGFEPFADTPGKLFLTMADIRASLNT